MLVVAPSGRYESGTCRESSRESVEVFCLRQAKRLTDNPTLMRLRELEVLEKVASTGNLNVILGEKGLADRVVNLL